MGALQAIGRSYRVRKGWYPALISEALQATTLIMAGYISVVYDNDTDDIIQMPDATIGVGFSRSVAQRPFAQDGWVTDTLVFETTGGSIKANNIYIEVGAWNDAGLNQPRAIFAAGYLGSLRQPVLGIIEKKDEWATWVFQGTVLEDATGGTHVCSLTVSPTVPGGEMQVAYGQIVIGNTATAQTPDAFVTDGGGGGNDLFRFLNPASIAFTTALVRVPLFQVTDNTPAAIIADIDFAMPNSLMISGSQALVMRVSTTAISVTQTFSLVCRIRGGMPTATLADSVGTPVLTTNTNAVF